MRKPKKIKITVRSVLNTIVTLLLIASVALCLSVTVQVSNKGYSSIGGYSLFKVMTGSMEPTINIDAVILTKKVNIGEIKIGDIVCFKSKSPSMLGRIITHRVVDISIGQNYEIVLTTKGDANVTIDSYTVTSDNLIGKVIHYSNEGSFFTVLLSIFRSKTGFLMVVAFPCLLIAGLIFKDSVGTIKNDMKRVVDKFETDGDNEVKELPSKQKKKSTKKKGVNETSSSLPGGMTPEQYEEMCARIRAELIEELRRENDRE